MSTYSRPSNRRTQAPPPKRRPPLVAAAASDPKAELVVPGTFSANSRHFFIVNGGGSECSQAVLSFLLEACWARKQSETGFLYLEDCVTADGNANYVAKLAGELRRACGHSRYVVTGAGCYWLLFEARNISLSPRILEMKSLDPRVLEKLSAVIDTSAD